MPFIRMLQTAPCYSKEAPDAWAPGHPGEPGAPEAPGTQGPPPIFEAFAAELEAPVGAPLEALLKASEGGPSPSQQVKEAMQELLGNRELHPTTRHALLNATLLLRSKKMVEPKP